MNTFCIFVDIFFKFTHQTIWHINIWLRRKTEHNSMVRLPSQNVDIFLNAGKNKTC